MSRTAQLALALTLAFAAAASAWAAEPAVARPAFSLDGRREAGGLVFFVPALSKAGAAAVGTAHTFDLSKLVRAQRVDFALARSGAVVASSSGFLAPPGRPFTDPQAELPDDFVVYALDAPPTGVRVLEIETELNPVAGDRVQLLGAPAGTPHDEDDIFGRIVETSDTRIEVDLDAPSDLRGWGGAPLLSTKTGRVIGILQAHRPRGATSRVTASPLGGVRAALGAPLERGAGRPFGHFAKSIADRAKEKPPPRLAASTRGAPSRGAAPRSKRAGPLIAAQASDGTRVHVEIEYPSPGALISGEACGTFVAGRALALHGDLHRFDVVLVIDTSRSTIDPTGADINGNGVIGEPRLGALGSFFDAGSTDPGDSILAAEVAAARQLLRGLDPRSTRVSVVTFAGDPPGARGGFIMHRRRAAAITLEPLTSDFARIERALLSVLMTEPEGSTHMAAGVDQATIELVGLRGARSTSDPDSEKVVFFFTDGQPTLPYGPGFEADNVRAVLRAADRSRRGEIRIHSFAIGPHALDGPIAPVEMAARTNGYFTPVRHPGDLVDVVEQVSFANLREVTLRNLTTGEPAERFRTTADGSWAGFVRTVAGANRIEIRAKADDGIEASSEVEVRIDPNAAAPAVPEAFVTQRNRLLEECLRDIKRVRVAAEAEATERVRQDLRMEIEQERAKARKRADEQRKRLELEVEEDANL